MSHTSRRRASLPPIQRSRGSRRSAVAGSLAASLGLLVLGLAAGPARSDDHGSHGVGLPRTPAPPDARVYFITPLDGETVASPVIVRFGLSGMGVAPAGVAKEATGHHHLVVDAELPPAGLPVPSSDHYRHFGGGQTEVSLELEPGEHTLQLLLGDQNHVPHDPPVASERITIRVE